VSSCSAAETAQGSAAHYAPSSSSDTGKDCATIHTPPLIRPGDDSYMSGGRGGDGVLHTTACYWSVGAASSAMMDNQLNVFKKRKGSPYSIAERRVPELIPVLGSHKPGGRLPLLSARPAVTLATLKMLLPILKLGEQRHDGREQTVT